MKKWIPLILVVAMAVWALSSLHQPPETGFHTREFGKLPVLMDGRFQPFDSVARNSLLQIRARQTVAAEENGRPQTMTAMEWLLEVMMKPEQADGRKIFRIDNNEVTELLKLPDNQKYYSFNQIRPQADELEKQADRIEPIDSTKRTVFESQLMKLFSEMNLYQRLEISLKPPASDDFAAELDAYQKSIAPGIAAMSARDAGQKFDQAAFNNLVGFMGNYETVARFALPLTIPPADPGLPRDDWQNIGTNLMQTARTREINPATKFYAAMVTTYRSDLPDDFNRSVAGYRVWLADRFAPQLQKAGREFFFSILQPFYKTTVIYVFALVLGLLSWFNMSDWLRRSSFYLVILAWVIHTFGLVFRMVLEGRPPVTNLYSSAIFIGWAAVFLGMALEKIYRDGIGCVVAAFVGFVTQVIAHNRHPRLRLDLCGRISGHHLHPARRVHPNAHCGNRQVTGADGLWHCLFRHAVQFCRHRVGRHLGRPVLGPVLGLGSEGKRRAAHRALERDHPARALGRPRARTRPHEPRGVRQHRHQLLLVWRQHARHRPAQLRVHGRGVQVADALHRNTARHHSPRPAAGENVEKFFRPRLTPAMTPLADGGGCKILVAPGGGEIEIICRGGFENVRGPRDGRARRIHSKREARQP
jgi:hypothetical protein